MLSELCELSDMSKVTDVNFFPIYCINALEASIDGLAYKLGTLTYIDTDMLFVLQETQVTLSVDSIRKCIHCSARGVNTCSLVSGDLVKD